MCDIGYHTCRCGIEYQCVESNEFCENNYEQCSQCVAQEEELRNFEYRRWEQAQWERDHGFEYE